jgi:hypothetical protein
MLVIFLKSKGSPHNISIVAIQVDEATNVERERCDCRSSNSKCRITCLERKSGYLLAQRWEAESKLSSFNIAKLGIEQKMDNENGWDKVKRVSLKFDIWESEFISTNDIYGSMLTNFRRSISVCRKPLQM